MSDISKQIKQLHVSSIKYYKEIEDLIDQAPIFKTPEFVNVSVALKMAMIEASRAVFSVIEIATEREDVERSAIYAEIGRGKALLEAVKSGAIKTIRHFTDSDNSTAQPASASTGLFFPYPTKALEAASAAASKFWLSYDPARPPLQKQVAAFIGERGVPARQAQELAIAIKPDGLAKT